MAHAVALMDPPDVVDVWRKHIEPAAKQLGLKLVSPTLFGHSTTYLDWAANLFARCYRLRDEPNFPCNVSSLERLSVHAYDCTEQFYQYYYTRNGTNSFTNRLMSMLETLLGDEYDDTFFKGFFDRTKIWITEFSCAADSTQHTLPMPLPNVFSDPYPYGQAPYDEQCRRASGQAPASHGKGVIKTLTDMDEVERFNWYGLVAGIDRSVGSMSNVYVGSGNFIVHKDGTVLPPGRLLLTSYRGLADLNCSLPAGVSGNDEETATHSGTDRPDGDP